MQANNFGDHGSNDLKYRTDFELEKYSISCFVSLYNSSKAEETNWNHIISLHSLNSFSCRPVTEKGRINGEIQTQGLKVSYTEPA